MDIFSTNLRWPNLPRLGCIDTAKLWQDLRMDPVEYHFPLLDVYCERHDEWTDKIRVMGLDGGIMVDYRTLPGLDRLFNYIYNQAGWMRPEIYVVSDLGRKGIGPWAALSVVSRSNPIMLLGKDLVAQLDEIELTFVIGHETAYIMGYTDEWRKDMSLSHLIREFAESRRLAELEKMSPDTDWRALYRQLMRNSRTMEMRCDRLGMLICGDYQKAATALIAVTLKSHQLAKRVHLENYLAVQRAVLCEAPAAGPISMNNGHPFLPDRILSLSEFNQSGQLESFKRFFQR
jgi:Zn-dependent protease with chaperone function